MAFQFLGCVAKAMARNAGHLFDVIPGGDFVFNVAVDCFEFYRSARQIDGLRAEIQEMAVASPQQIQEYVRLAVKAEAGRQPAKVQKAMTGYLTQVPAMIRRSLRRPSDPTGTSLHAGVSLKQASDLLPFLPPCPPRFHAGQRPLPGIDWELEELLGIGGFGEVWKARHPYMKSKRPVALKFCLEESAAKTLWNEAGVLDAIMQQGRHPGIVPLQMIYLKASPPCLEYEYVSGGDLGGLIQELSQKGKLTPALATQMIRQLAKTVSFFHQLRPPVVHCDLKPANILVQQDSKGTTILRIADFGIGGVVATQALKQTKTSKSTREHMLTDAVRGAYTPLYASPQQMQRRPGNLPDPRDDVHALGVIWYQLLTGDLNMVSMPTDWQEEVQDCGLSLNHIGLLGSCIASREEKRPGNAQELLDRLSRLPVSSAGSSSTKHLVAAKRRGVGAIPTAKRRSSSQPITQSPSRLPGQVSQQGIPANSTTHVPSSQPQSGIPFSKIRLLLLVAVGLFFLLVITVSYLVFVPGTTKEIDSTDDNSDVVFLKKEDESKLNEPLTAKQNNVPKLQSGPLKGHHSYVSSIAFSPDGNFLASGSSDCDIRLWRLPEGECFATLQGHAKSVERIALSPNGETLASSSGDNTIKLWRVPSGTNYATLKDYSSGYSSFVFSPDGSILACTNRTKTTIELWSTATGNNFATLRGHSRGSISFAFSPDGKIFASCSSDKLIKLWRMPSGESLATLQGHSGFVERVIFSPDGSILASTGRDNTIKLWDMPSGKIAQTLERINSLFVTRAIFSPDGKTMASPASDNSIMLWGMPSGNKLVTLQGSGAIVENLVFALNGKILASCANSEKIIRLWNLELYNKPWAANYANLTGHSDSISNIAISPDGTILASGSTDKTIRLWKIPFPK